MPPKFGTSGLRGLVTELTPDLVRRYTAAFLNSCNFGTAVYIGWDLRPSSPAIAKAVSQEIRARGIRTQICGALPTPALAYAASEQGASAIMVTGSHIPADRNGLKFYTPAGEISKADESAILSKLDRPSDQKLLDAPDLITNNTARDLYVARYLKGFPPDGLAGLKIGVYQHSSVARDIVVEILQGLGAKTVEIARSDSFVPVDTEAITKEARNQFRTWCKMHALDSLVSTDGDADRPMVTDETGNLVPGDTLGAITARAFNATTICTPISANTQIQKMQSFANVIQTKIGSPFVIEAIENCCEADHNARVVGFEPNGGFLLGFDIVSQGRTVKALPTRDAILPIITALQEITRTNTPLSKVVDALPSRFTAADRLQNVSPEMAVSLLNSLQGSSDARTEFFETDARLLAIDLTDGLRVTFPSAEIVHLRASGNAPELRCYAEAASNSQARRLVEKYISKLRIALRHHV